MYHGHLMTWQALHSTEDAVLRYKSEANIVLGHVVGKEYCFPIIHGDRLVASPGLLIPLGREISFEYNPLFRCARRTSPLCSGSYVCVSNHALLHDGRGYSCRECWALVQLDPG